jgi:hypothetical protein
MSSRCATLAFAALVLGACNSTTGTHALFEQQGSNFYALPFPNDLHRNADGTLDLTNFPTNSLIVDEYRMDAEVLDGFSLNAAEFALFDGPLDPASLPDEAGSTQPGASVYVVNIDPTSPNLGKRTPVIVHFRADGTMTIGPNRLVVRPVPGFTLDEGTVYALIITNRIRAGDGTAVVAQSEFEKLRDDTGATDAYSPLRTYLASSGDEDPKAIISAAVFTTQHATFVAPGIRRAVYATTMPVATAVVTSGPGASWTEWTGSYMAPNFQTGTPPYLNDGGEIQFDSTNTAIVQRTETMRFALTVPPGATPATGWPIAIYQHGTGGDYQTFIQDGTAGRLAAQGIAVISTDQVLHGPRDPAGTDPGVAFYNFSNPFAGRDNALQGYADAWSQLRLAMGMSIVDTDRTITFDPDRVMFFGHSQGSETSPGFIAYEPQVKGAVLSGAGGVLYLSLLLKTQPVDLTQLVTALVRDDPVDEDNPTLALAQMWIERADPANYGRYFTREPQLGPDGTQMAPRNIFQSEGFIDTYAPNPGIEAFATAIGGNEVVTANEKDIDGLTLRGNMSLAPPISDNLNGKTAVLAQYNMAAGSDGHFVVFEIPAAEQQSAEFLGTLAATGTATVVVPSN